MKVKVIHCYVVQVKAGGISWADEVYLHQDNKNDEELKKAAFDKKKELENTYFNEEFRIILREEFEEEISQPSC